MPLFRFGQSWDSLGDLEQEVDQLLRSVNLTFQGIRLGRPYPAINLYETEAAYLLTAELPGAKLEEIELTVGGGMLTLKGRRGGVENVSENSFRRSERFRGEWKRSLTLPGRVREEDLSATFTDGVLKVRLPKGAQNPPRQIPVGEHHGRDSRAERDHRAEAEP